MKKLTTLRLNFAVAVLLVFFLIFSSSYTSNTAYAVKDLDYEYSNVLDDLQKDSNFSIEFYPEKATDYSLQIIQIAESVDKKLFIYVYQPSGQRKDLRYFYNDK